MARLLLALVCISVNGQPLPTPQEERGRQIYIRGTSPGPNGTIWANLAGGTRVAGSLVPCANCHGNNGLGRGEAKIVPSNITWEALTKPYGVTRADETISTAYTERSLRRAFTMGISSSGNSLNAAMPRFEMSQSDAADLISYLKRLGKTFEAGLTEDTIRIGVFLSPSAANRTLRRMLLDYFARVNGGGGAFGRRIELTFFDLPEIKRAAAAIEFFRNEQQFALIGDFSGSEAELAAAMNESRTPAIAAFAQRPFTAADGNPYVFYLDGGLDDEIDSLIQFARERFGNKGFQTAIVSSTSEAGERAAGLVRSRLEMLGLKVSSRPDSDDIVFWLRPDCPPMANSRGVFLIPGSLGETPCSTDPAGRIFLASVRRDSNGPIDRVWLSATVLTEAIRSAGRDLSRAALMDAMEQFRGPIHYAPGRRIGSREVGIWKFAEGSNAILERNLVMSNHN